MSSILVKIALVVFFFFGLLVMVISSQLDRENQKEATAAKAEWENYAKVNDCKIISTQVADVFYKRDTVTYKCSNGTTHTRQP